MGPGASSGATARRAALDLLARREHSLAELRRKLNEREFPAEEIEATLERLAAEGLASDERFAAAFIAARARRGQGPARIRAELQQRGVAADIMAAGFEAAAADWSALARDARVKRFGAAAPADFRERARQARFLQQRGFTAEQVRGAFAASDED